LDQLAKKCGNRIRTAREDRNMLQRELADKAGVPVRTIGRIERGEVDVRLGTLTKIAKALMLNVRELV
jgi:XRE family transcriptional regulator, regulator of sulfur utilization